jgi:Ca2+-binding EF-hand superfamily protein
MIRLRRLLLPFCLVIAGSATAQTAPPEGLVSRLQGGASVERYLEVVRTEFHQIDADANGELTADDIGLMEAVQLANVRTNEAMRFMYADLDGDGAVTEDEVRRKLRFNEHQAAAMQKQYGPLSQAAEERIEQQVRQTMAADADKDGRVTWAEALARFKPTGAQLGIAQRVQQMIALGGEGRQSVRLAEVEEAARAAFRAVDTDGNGTISQDELMAAHGMRQRVASRQAEERRNAERLRMEEELRAACRMPKASDEAKVVVLSVHKAEALSRLALASQDVKTGTAEIRIEPGSEPLYVVAVAKEATIWRVTGATERVERFVATATTTSEVRMATGMSIDGMNIAAGFNSAPMNKVDKPVPLAGVVGVPRERVSLLANANCLAPFTEARSSEGARTLAAVRQDTGKQAATVAARVNIGAFLLPSGKIQSAHADSDEPRLVIVKEFGTLKLTGDTSGVVVRTGPVDLENETAQTSPGGVVEIDERSVVASTPVQRYDVLPGPSGLIQLMNSGALTRTRRGEFVIHRKVRFPAALAGHSVTFLLMPNVPIPEGNPDGSTVISEETGQPIEFRGKNN